MGYFTRNNGQIKCFWPDNTETEFYKQSGCGLNIHETLKEAAAHFKTSTYELMEHGTIEGEKIHTDCLTYDCYDSGDYTDFLCITYTRK